MPRPKGSQNKLTVAVKDKLQKLIDDIIYQLDITEMSTDQKIKMLQIGFQYVLPKLREEPEEKNILENPPSIDFRKLFNFKES